jgi:hypothetical protein
MKYLGIARVENGTLVMPDAFREVAGQADYEAVQVGDAILLLAAPLDQERLKRIEALTQTSIDEHRKSLEGLAR